MYQVIHLNISIINYEYSEKMHLKTLYRSTECNKSFSRVAPSQLLKQKNRYIMHVLSAQEP